MAKSDLSVESVELGIQLKIGEAIRVSKPNLADIQDLDQTLGNLRAIKIPSGC